MPSGSREAPEREERDWEAAEHAVSDAYFPHVLRPIEAGTSPSLNVRATQLGALRLARIGWGAEVSVRTQHPGAYAVNIPVSGHIESISGGQEVYSEPGQASVFAPDTDAVITRWTENCEIVGVKLDRDYLHRELARVTGRPDLHLPAQVDLSTPAGRSWTTLLESVVAQVRAEDALLQNPLVADQLAGAVTTAFVLAVMPGAMESTAPVRPRIVKRVLDRLHDDPSQSWTAADMAEVAGVSVRRLQEAFHEYVGVAPREYLLDVRLDHIHADLAAADPGTTTVTDIAMRWGITHTGRFAAAYRRRFGVAPSDTLRR
ncbi:AraC family transcriptional regulator [Aldersonia sp. NBC_00410]|uniref:AraC family transcriptional regulator n=1 Tax=Aldersonia sp. NBC_00410 TaxID=2975954 RepID=UPI002252BFDC|nr:AraC family transcriptional regulator [Aldersonia sp. NBC_00410]MCX5044152.1 AraC family transcriptional regulator [Aldersonia sp. NBC_00410]